MLRNTLQVCLIAAYMLLASATVRAQDAVAPATDSLNPAAVYRFDPILDQLIEVPANEIKPGYLYNRYSSRLRRRVWSLAASDGTFAYAMGPGSVQTARSLDLRATPEQLQQVLASAAPELAKMLEARGGLVYVRLDDDDKWVVVPTTTIASVFDLETGRRWEWHGGRRVAVVHTYGYEWELIGGQFVPAFVYRPGLAAFCR